MNTSFYLLNATSLNENERTAIRVINQSLANHRDLVSMATGRALGFMTPLPVEVVSSIKEYFKMNADIEIKKSISLIREFCDIDPNGTYEFAEKFYLLRHELITPGKDIYCINPDTIAEAALGITNVIENDAIRVMRENPVDFCRIHNAVRKFLEERQLKSKEHE